MLLKNYYLDSGSAFDDPRIKRFIAVFESEPIKNYIIQRFNGTVIPAW